MRAECIPMAPGVFVWLCRRGRKPAQLACACGAVARYQCDGPRAGGHCNEPVCEAHACAVGAHEFCAACAPAEDARQLRLPGLE